MYELVINCPSIEFEGGAFVETVVNIYSEVYVCDILTC
jgi:hypothetical protein